jgi:hypothetical protein
MQISICMRIKTGARKINAQGGAIFIHGDGSVPSRIIVNPVKAPLAPIEIRDTLYSQLINVSPATHFRRLFITGENGLLTRGLNKRHLGNYGGLPAEWRERDRLARQIQKESNDPPLLSESELGVPGFWTDQDGVHLWKKKDFILPVLLIPVRDAAGRIQACQIRSPLATKAGSRYFWLSSSDLPNGVGSGSPLHFKCKVDDPPQGMWIIVVEGVLKADILSALRPDLPIVATPCVSANHDRLVDLLHGRPIIIAFDQDYYSNETVCFHLTSLISKRIRQERSIATTRIASWAPHVKGIDDAAVQNLSLTSISVQTWFNRLTPRFQQIVIPQFAGIPNFPRS